MGYESIPEKFRAPLRILGKAAEAAAPHVGAWAGRKFFGSSAGVPGQSGRVTSIFRRPRRMYRRRYGRRLRYTKRYRRRYSRKATRFSSRRRRYRRSASDGKGGWTPKFTEVIRNPYYVVSNIGNQGVSVAPILPISELETMRTYAALYIPRDFGAATGVSDPLEALIRIHSQKHFFTITSQSPAAQNLSIELWVCRNDTTELPAVMANKALTGENDFHLGTAVDLSTTQRYVDISKLPRVNRYWRRISVKNFFMVHGQVARTSFVLRPRRFFALWMRNNTSSVYLKGISFVFRFVGNGTPIAQDTDSTLVSSSPVQFSILHDYARSYRMKSISNHSYRLVNNLNTVTTPVVMNEFGPATDVSAS